MSDSEDDSILENIQKTRDLWTTKADTGPLDYLIPKSPLSPVKPIKSPPPVENHVNGNHAEEDIIRFEDQVEEDFDLPDVKSLKSQWEKAGPVPTPQKKAPLRQSSYNNVHRPNSVDLIPVNREPEEQKEEYEVELGKLREKFEREAKRSKMKKARRRSYKMQNMCSKFESKKFTSKLTFRLAANSKVVWSDGPRTSVSKEAVDSRINKKKKHDSMTKAQTSKTSSNERFEAEIQAQRSYQPSKENLVEVPTVELSSIKRQFEQRKDEKVVTPYTPSKRKPREASFSSDSSAPIEIVRYDDPPEEEVKYEIELGSIRKKFEQNANQSRQPVRSYNLNVQKKTVSPVQSERVRAASESENVAKGEVVRSSEARYDEMIGQESVKDRLARYRAITEESKAKTSSRKITLKPKQHTFTSEVVEVKKSEETVFVEQDIVRSPPAGTKEVPEYTASIDLQQAKEIFDRTSSQNSRRSRSSRSSSASPQRQSPRSHSTPSPTNRRSGRSSASSSKSPSPVRNLKRESLSSSQSSLSSGRGSPQPRSKTKKVGDPDVVVLEHSEVNYYYEEGKRLNTKVRGPDDIEKQNSNMSNGDVIRSQPAGTKEDVDYVPSLSMHSTRDMFEKPQDDEPVRGRAPPPKKTIIIESPGHRSDSSDGNSPERNPDVVRSTTAGTREEPVYEMSLDLKAARSKFESPQRPEVYVPRNTIQKREEEARRQRAAAAAASPRSSESSESSGYEVIKTTEAGSREKPEYQVNLKATKHLFEGGSAPTPIKREGSSTRTKQHVEVKGEIVRPEPAGTREIVEIKVSNDVKSVKQKFENSDSADEDMARKEPIDIQQEARMVVHKDREVKEEVEKSKEVAKSMSSSASETASEGEAIFEQDSSTDGREVVSDVVKTEKQESVSSSDSEQAPPAAAVPVRVAIPEDLSAPEKQEVEEPSQEYETYSKVIDYNEDIQEQNPSSSESESDKEVEANHVKEEKEQEILVKDKQEEEPTVQVEQKANEMTNHVAESPASDQRRGSSSSDDQEEISQQETGTSLSSSSLQEKGGSSSSAEEGSGFLQ